MRVGKVWPSLNTLIRLTHFLRRINYEEGQCLVHHSSTGCTPEPSDTAGTAFAFTTTIPQVFQWRATCPGCPDAAAGLSRRPRCDHGEFLGPLTEGSSTELTRSAGRATTPSGGV